MRTLGNMTIHLLKLCVGVASVDELAELVAWRQAEKRRLGQPDEQYHVTRMMPKQTADLLDGGSLYWVIKGAVQVRQKLMDLRPFTDDQGVHRCRLVMEPVLVETERQPRRPFQGWRYLRHEDAPADLASGNDSGLPGEIRNELAELGIL